MLCQHTLNVVNRIKSNQIRVSNKFSGHQFRVRNGFYHIYTIFHTARSRWIFFPVNTDDKFSYHTILYNNIRSVGVNLIIAWEYNMFGCVCGVHVYFWRTKNKLFIAFFCARIHFVRFMNFNRWNMLFLLFFQTNVTKGEREMIERKS